MRNKIISSIWLLCFLAVFLPTNVAAFENFEYRVLSTTTTPKIGSEFEIVVSLTNYDEKDDEIDSLTINYKAEVISVDISWGSMEFVYDAGIWDRDRHKWVDAGWNPTEENGNLITMLNKGNVPVQVVLSYNQTDSYEAISAKFYDDSDCLSEIEPIAFLPEGSEQNYWLKLYGKTENRWVDEFATIGTVTVTIIA